MPTTTLDPRTDPTAVARAAEVLRAGGLVAFPTETVYGLGADALSADAVAGIFAAKGRPSNNPLIVHVATVADAARLAEVWPDDAARLADRFWPGPLTLVLPRAAAVPDAVTAGGPTVALRLPAHDVARALILAAGVPLAAPSANRSGNVSPTTAAHVAAELGGRIALVLDGGPTTGGIESTVLDLSRTPPRLLRPGGVTPGEIESVVGPIQRGAVVVAGAAMPSPGLLSRHYAPRTPVELVEEPPPPSADAVFVTYRPSGPGEMAMPADPAGYAARLYAALRECDARGLGRIVVLMPPDAEAWLAVRDRLRRAAAQG